LLVADIGDGHFSLAAEAANFFLHALQWLDATPAQHHRGALLGKP
jgi:hypothetical protein